MITHNLEWQTLKGGLCNPYKPSLFFSPFAIFLQVADKIHVPMPTCSGYVDETSSLQPVIINLQPVGSKYLRGVQVYTET